MTYEAEIAVEDLPDIPPPDLDIEFVEVEPLTELEDFISDGKYVVYRQAIDS